MNPVYPYSPQVSGLVLLGDPSVRVGLRQGAVSFAVRSGERHP